EERVRHRRIVVLTCVDHEWKKNVRTLLHGSNDRRHFHEVWPSTDYVDHFEHSWSWVFGFWSSDFCLGFGDLVKAPDQGSKTKVRGESPSLCFLSSIDRSTRFACLRRVA